MANLQRPRLITTSTTTDICTLEDELGQRASFPKFKYSHLPLGRTIRLLRAQPQTEPWHLSPLSKINEFTLIEHELDDTDVASLDVSKSPYIPMSYSWGEPIFDSPLVILVKGKRTVLPVTASAWEVVQRILPATSMQSKFMWIDQISINQDDSEEKSEQVKLMGEIYHRCWHCMIWLGSAEDTTQSAFSLLHALQKLFPIREDMPLGERDVINSSHSQIRADLVLKLKRDLLPPETHSGWVEVAKILQKSWFTRLWTFQEAILSYTGNATICYGKYHIPFVTFMRASMLLGYDHTFVGIEFRYSRAALRQISMLRVHVQRGQVSPLIWLLENNVLRNCFNPLDRIYAFLGLRKEDGPEFPINVDYNKTPSELFTEVTREIIRSQNSLRFCANAGERLQGSNLSTLPSWVPDWTTGTAANPFEWANPLQPFFNASNRRAHVDRIIQDSKMLIVEGMIIDTILDIIDVEFPDIIIAEEKQKHLVTEILPKLQEALRRRAPGKSETHYAHMITNTITVGGFMGNKNHGNLDVDSGHWSEATCGQIFSRLFNKDPPPTSTPLLTDFEGCLQALTRQAAHCVNRRFVILENNSLGLVPHASRKGDSIAILHGSSLPFVLGAVQDQ